MSGAVIDIGYNNTTQPISGLRRGSMECYASIRTVKRHGKSGDHPFYCADNNIEAPRRMKNRTSGGTL